ncbi:MAG: hypothetical protein V7K41_00600 [Nostoc sp.]
MQQNPHLLAIAYICDDPKEKMDKVELRAYPKTFAARKVMNAQAK